MEPNNNNRNANNMNMNNYFSPKNSINAKNNNFMYKSAIIPPYQINISQNSNRNNNNQINNNNLINNNNANNNQFLYQQMNSDENISTRIINGIKKNNYIQSQSNQNVNNQYMPQNNNNQIIYNQNQNFQDYSLRKGSGMIATDEVSDFIVKLCKKSIDKIIKEKNDPKFKEQQTKYIIKYLKQLINGEWFVLLCDVSSGNFDFKFSNAKEENIMIFRYKNYEIYICLLYINLTFSSIYNYDPKNQSINDIDMNNNENKEINKANNDINDKNNRKTIDNKNNIYNNSDHVIIISNDKNKKDMKKSIIINDSNNNNYKMKESKNTINNIINKNNITENNINKNDNKINKTNNINIDRNKTDNNMNKNNRINDNKDDKVDKINNINEIKNKDIDINQNKENKDKKDNKEKKENKINENNNVKNNNNKNKEEYKNNRIHKNNDNNKKIDNNNLANKKVDSNNENNQKNNKGNNDNKQNNNNINNKNDQLPNKRRAPPCNIRLYYLNKKKEENKKQQNNENKNNIDNNKKINSPRRFNDNKLIDINKPDDIIEPIKIDYNKREIPINNPELKRDKRACNEIQRKLKRILNYRKLPLFDFDNYLIQKTIGEGTFGQLYLVLNNKTKKAYAMKELVCQDINSFENNIKSLEINYKNKHKNILDIYGIYVIISDEKLFFLYVLMPLGEGDWETEVSKRIETKNYYSENELVYILKELTSALAFLQRKNVAHRDIKLENTLLFKNEDKKNNEFDKIYKICDFGEAKQRINYNTKHNTVRGTDYYMSPQLLDGYNKNLDYIKNNPHKSDVFSLGCCMIIAASLNCDVIDHIRNEKKQEEIDDIIRTYLEDRYPDKFINIVTKMIIYNEYKRIDFIELEKLLKKEY